MEWKKSACFLLFLISSGLLFAQEQAYVSVAREDEFQQQGLYLYSRVHPVNTIVEITNPVNGISRNATVIAGIPPEDVAFKLSRQLARELNLSEGSSVYYTSKGSGVDRLYHPDPDINPGAGLALAPLAESGAVSDVSPPVEAENRSPRRVVEALDPPLVLPPTAQRSADSLQPESSVLPDAELAPLSAPSSHEATSDTVNPVPGSGAEVVPPLATAEAVAQEAESEAFASPEVSDIAGRDLGTPSARTPSATSDTVNPVLVPGAIVLPPLATAEVAEPEAESEAFASPEVSDIAGRDLGTPSARTPSATSDVVNPVLVPGAIVLPPLATAEAVAQEAESEAFASPEVSDIAGRDLGTPSARTPSATSDTVNPVLVPGAIVLPPLATAEVAEPEAESEAFASPEVSDIAGRDLGTPSARTPSATSDVVNPVLVPGAIVLPPLATAEVAEPEAESEAFASPEVSDIAGRDLGTPSARTPSATSDTVNPVLVPGAIVLPPLATAEAVAPEAESEAFASPEVSDIAGRDLGTPSARTPSATSDTVNPVLVPGAIVLPPLATAEAVAPEAESEAFASPEVSDIAGRDLGTPSARTPSATSDVVNPILVPGAIVFPPLATAEVAEPEAESEAFASPEVSDIAGRDLGTPSARTPSATSDVVNPVLVPGAIVFPPLATAEVAEPEAESEAFASPEVSDIAGRDLGTPSARTPSATSDVVNPILVLQATEEPALTAAELSENAAEVSSLPDFTVVGQLSLTSPTAQEPTATRDAPALTPRVSEDAPLDAAMLSSGSDGVPEVLFFPGSDDIDRQTLMPPSALASSAAESAPMDAVPEVSDNSVLAFSNTTTPRSESLRFSGSTNNSSTFGLLEPDQNARRAQDGGSLPAQAAQDSGQVVLLEVPPFPSASSEKPRHSSNGDPYLPNTDTESGQLLSPQPIFPFPTLDDALDPARRDPDLLTIHQPEIVSPDPVVDAAQATPRATGDLPRFSVPDPNDGAAAQGQETDASLEIPLRSETKEQFTLLEVGTEQGLQEEDIPAAVSSDVAEPHLEVPSMEFQKNAYYAQVGAYKNRDNAANVTEVLNEEFPSFMYQEEVLYKVLVGPVQPDERGVVLHLLQSKGYTGFFRKGETF